MPFYSYSLKHNLAVRGGINTFKKMVVTPGTRYLYDVEPMTNQALWQKNLRAYLGFLDFARGNNAIAGSMTYCGLLRECLDNLKRGVRFKSDEHGLKQLIAGSIHYYLLGFAECIEYRHHNKLMDPLLLDHSGHSSREWIEAANRNIIAIEEISGQNLNRLHFYPY